VRNNPVTYVDPSGEIAPILILTALGFGVGFGLNTWQQYQQNKGWCGFELLPALGMGLETAFLSVGTALLVLSGIGMLGIGLQGIGMLAVGIPSASIAALSLEVFDAGIALSAFSAEVSSWFLTGQGSTHKSHVGQLPSLSDDRSVRSGEIDFIAGPNGQILEVPKNLPPPDATRGVIREALPGFREPAYPLENWFNPLSKVSLHPDPSHTLPIGPHWDISWRGNPVSGTQGTWRIFKNGIILPK